MGRSELGKEVAAVFFLVLDAIGQDFDNETHNELLEASFISCDGGGGGCSAAVGGVELGLDGGQQPGAVRQERLPAETTWLKRFMLRECSAVRTSASKSGSWRRAYSTLFLSMPMWLAAARTEQPIWIMMQKA